MAKQKGWSLKDVDEFTTSMFGRPLFELGSRELIALRVRFTDLPEKKS